MEEAEEIQGHREKHFCPGPEINQDNAVSVKW